MKRGALAIARGNRVTRAAWLIVWRCRQFLLAVMQNLRSDRLLVVCTLPLHRFLFLQTLHALSERHLWVD